MVAAFGLGAGWAALDRAIPYSAERIQAGSPLSEKQGYTHKLIVPHAVRLEAARAAIEETAARIDAGEGALNTEGAIAKYLASEAGKAAADAAIQALGGYGYTHEYLVEKITRDVRITTIYEGTSEIMEMTVARDRWQQHLKTRGEHYHVAARALEALHAQEPAVGADIAALAHHALADALEGCRVTRLTRNQHVLLRLGSWWRRSRAPERSRAAPRRQRAGELPEKAPHRLPAAALAAMSRANARDVALQSARTGSAGWRAPPAQDLAFARLPAIHAAQAGLLADLDAVADALYGRRSHPAAAMTRSAERAVAIIGVGAILPGARDAATFWRNVREGQYAISDVDPARWDPVALLRPRPARAGEDVLEDRRLGARLGLGPAGVGAPDAAQGHRRDGRRARSGPWPARGWRCTMPVGRSGRWTSTARP